MSASAGIVIKKKNERFENEETNIEIIMFIKAISRVSRLIVTEKPNVGYFIQVGTVIETVVRFTRWSRNGRRTRWKSCYSNTTFLSKDSKQRFICGNENVYDRGIQVFADTVNFCDYTGDRIEKEKTSKQNCGARCLNESKSHQIFMRNTNVQNAKKKLSVL